MNPLNRSATSATAGTSSVPLLSKSEREHAVTRSWTLKDVKNLEEDVERTRSNQRATQVMTAVRSGVSKPFNRTKSMMAQIDTGEDDIPEADEDEGKITTMQAATSIANLLVGAGMLTLPYGFKLSGWMGGGILLFVVGAMTWTAFLIGKAFDATAEQLEKSGIREEARDFSALAFLAFGRKGRIFMGVTFALELWLALEAFLVLIGIQVNHVIGITPSNDWGQVILISGCVSYALLYAPMKVLAYLSMVNSVVIFSTLCLFFCSGWALPADGPDYDSFHDLWLPKGLFSTLGLCLFCFAGHPCLPSIYWKMEDRSKFNKACMGGFGIAGVFYGVVCCIGYYFFGTFLKKSFTRQLGQDLNGNSIAGLNMLGYAACVGFVIKLQGTIPLIFGPVLTVFEELCCAKGASGMSKTALRVSMMTLSIVGAIVFKDKLDKLGDVCGCAMTMITSILFPCAMYFRIAEHMNLAMRVGIAAMCVFGIVFGVLGTLDALLGGL